MTRRKSGGEREEITVWPRAMPDELGSIPPPDSGLSVDTEDIGARFLSNATEQRGSQWPAGHDTGSYAFDDGSSEDGDGLDEAGYAADPRAWEARITRSLRVGKFRALLAPSEAAHARTRRTGDNDPGERPEYNHDELDLTDENVHESSLLDHEGDELGEVESPQLRTDDTHSHGRPRGGHTSGKRKKRVS